MKYVCFLIINLENVEIVCTSENKKVGKIGKEN